MPDKTTPGSPGLYLKVVSDAWEGRCPKWEQGKGRECDHLGYVFGPGVGALGCTLQVHGDYSCPYNTGTRRLRLVGMVRTTAVEDSMLGECEIYGFDETFNINTTNWMTQIIVKEYRRNNTLPADLMASDERPWGLRVEEVKDDATTKTD